jgi:glycosyltransferase involved in cell wall biosynthesis
MNDHPFTGHSGVSVYTRDLQPALRARGLGVATFHVGGRDWRFRPYLRVSQAEGTVLFAVTNAPIHADDSLLNPRQDVSSASVERLLGEAITRFRPHVVHLHTFYGLPFSLLRVARAHGARTVLQLHDFWQICSRLLLPRPDNVACHGPDGGRNCVRYCARPLTRRERLYRLAHWLPDGAARRAFFALRRAVRHTQHRTTTPYSPPPGGRYGVDDPSLLAGHGDRVRAGVGAFADADRILAVSSFVRDVFVRHDADADRVMVIPTALRLANVTWKPRAAQGPVRFGYFGRVTPTKGAHVFAAAAARLPAGAGRFLLFGPVDDDSRAYLGALAGPGRLEFRGPYARADLGRVFDEVDVAVVPTLVQETTGLVNVEAQAAGLPILASRLGAVPEIVHDGVNGFVFEAGDAEDLAAKMRTLVDDPGRIAAMSARTSRAASWERHVDEVLAIYRELSGEGETAHAEDDRNHSRRG